MNHVPFPPDRFDLSDLDHAVERGILDEEARIAFADRLSTHSLDLFDPGFLRD